MDTSPILYLLNIFIRSLLRTVIFRMNILIPQKQFARILNWAHEHFQKKTLYN